MPPPAELSEASIRLLLAEHDRIAALFIETRQMGERRTSLYLTLIAATTPLLALLSQSARGEFTPPLILLALFVLLMMGVLTFYRLIERRIETIKLLRAINCIHAAFVERQPELTAYLTWKAGAGGLSYVERRDSLPGLRDLVQVINACVAGIVAAASVSLLAPRVAIPALLAVGVAAAGLAWGGQQAIELRWLRRADGG